MVTIFPLFLLLQITYATDISELVFGNIDDAIPVAYGDFNSDELTDVFVIRNDFTTIDILLGSIDDHLLHQSSKFRCYYPNMKITSIVPGDFDGDAFMDVMFTSQKEDENVEIYINWGGPDLYNCTSNSSKPVITTIGEPLALDYNDDMIIDLFGMDENNNRNFWIFNKKRETPTSIPISDDEYLRKKIATPHSNAFLDLNDDFRPDLFITAEDKSVEIWHASKDLNTNHFVFNTTIHYDPSGSSNRHYGQSLFIDLELGGELNQLLPVCHDNECQNSTLWVHSGEHYHDLNINFYNEENKTQWGFIVPSNDDFLRRAITLRSGDFNNDGFPDLLATLKRTKSKGFFSSSETIYQTFLLENVKDTNAKPSDKFKRTFVVRWNALSPFGENTVMGSFYDFYSDGILDVILLQKNGKKYKPLAFRNTLDYDANFVKVIVLTGLTNKKPPAKETPFGAKRRNYGTNLPGPLIKYNTTTQEGKPQHGVSSQLPQSAYLSLHLPYTIFGLGRTPNFVDYIEIGLAGQRRQWPQTIPNSQIFVIPSPIDKPAYWKIQLFVTPSKIIIKSVFALLGICFVILLIILGLHIKERREDKLEKLQEAQRFHFDAM